MTHSQNEEKQDKQGKKRKIPLWLIIVGIFIAGFIITAILNSDNETPLAAEESQDDQENDETSEEPDDGADQGLSDRFEIQETEQGNAEVRFDVLDNMSSSGKATIAEQDTIRGIEAAIDEYPEYESVFVTGYVTGVNSYGEEVSTIAIEAQYDRETIEQINFENRHSIDIWKIRDGGAGCTAVLCD